MGDVELMLCLYVIIQTLVLVPDVIWIWMWIRKVDMNVNVKLGYILFYFGIGDAWS
jgi:hypothetical protein